MCCASTARVNEIGEKVICKYGNTEIGMPVFMDGISAIGDADTIRQGIRNCRKMESKKKIIYGLKKTNYMTMITGREKQEQTEEEVKEGKIDEVDTYSYLGIMPNKEGNLKEHIKETENQASRIIRDKWNIIKTECRTRRDQGKNQTLWDMPCTSNIIWVWSVGENIKKWDASNRKNTKSVIKENVTATSNNTSIWIANGDRYMASKGENWILSSDVNP